MRGISLGGNRPATILAIEPWCLSVNPLFLEPAVLVERASTYAQEDSGCDWRRHDLCVRGRLHRKRRLLRRTVAVCQAGPGRGSISAIQGTAKRRWQS